MDPAQGLFHKCKR